MLNNFLLFFVLAIFPTTGQAVIFSDVPENALQALQFFTNVTKDPSKSALHETAGQAIVQMVFTATLTGADYDPNRNYRFRPLSSDPKKAKEERAIMESALSALGALSVGNDVLNSYIQKQERLSGHKDHDTICDQIIAQGKHQKKEDLFLTSLNSLETHAPKLLKQNGKDLDAQLILIAGQIKDFTPPQVESLLNRAGNNALGRKVLAGLKSYLEQQTLDPEKTDAEVFELLNRMIVLNTDLLFPEEKKRRRDAFSTKTLKAIDDINSNDFLSKEKARKVIRDMVQKINSDALEITLGSESGLLKHIIPVFLEACSDIFWVVKKIDLKRFHLQTLPESIGNLTNLTSLVLEDSQLQTVPESIGNLTNLTRLVLGNNQLQTVPESIGNLTNLTRLVLGNNQLQTLPESIGNLTNLTSLVLEDSQLQTVPESIGNLTNLTRLVLGNNQLRQVPRSIENLVNLRVLELSINPLLQRGEGENLGRLELQQIFGDRVVLPSRTAPPIVKVSKEEVYRALDQQPLRLKRAELAKIKLPEISPQNMNAETFMAFWDKLVNSFNFDRETGEDYLSYELLAGDFAGGPQNRSNQERIKQELLPRLSGFLKTLWSITLSQGEETGWQMYEEQKPELQNALAYIVTEILQKPDRGTQSLLFAQLVNGILHCPTGQKEGIDTVILSLQQSGNQIASSFFERFKHLFAVKKTDVFKMAIMPGENAQNVHILSFYFDKLKNDLGLTSALSSYTERIGVFDDPFQGSEGNALQVFYEKFTPDYLINLLVRSTENEEDYQLAADLESLEKERQSLNIDKTTLLKQRDQFEKLLARVPEQQKTQYQNQLDKVQKQLDTIQASPISARDLENKKVENKKAQEKIKARQKTIAQFWRPFKIQDILRYLVDSKLMTPEKGWEDYFTEDPSKIGSKATLTEGGATRILIHMGLLLEK